MYLSVKQKSVGSSPTLPAMWRRPRASSNKRKTPDGELEVQVLSGPPLIREPSLVISGIGKLGNRMPVNQSFKQLVYGALG